jgi:phosphoserine phosphatase
MIRAYDFDKTLTYKDTSLLFLFYACNFLKMSAIKKLLIIFYAVCHKFSILTNDEFKSLSFLLVFKGKHKLEITKISKKFVKDNPNILNILGKRVAASLDQKQYILTASPECYVNLYFKTVTVIGTTFSFDLNNMFSGINRNCYGAKKVDALQEFGILTVDEFYTDSLSDRPMMEVSKSNFLVKRDQIQKFIIGD